MGMFTRLSHEGKLYPFKTGWDDLLTVRQGDTIHIFCDAYQLKFGSDTCGQ